MCNREVSISERCDLSSQCCWGSCAGSWVPWVEPTASDALELPQLSGSEWLMDPADVEILEDPDGQPIQLGAGSFGSVSPLTTACKGPSSAHACLPQQALPPQDI